MVNRRFVELYGNGQSMIGRHWRTGPTATPSEIAGIVGDVHEDGLMAPAAPYIYDCLRAGSWPDPEYVVRTRGDAQALARQIPAVVHSVEPGRAVFGVKMLDTVLDNALEQPRLNSRFLAAFAGIAMLLASVGLYSLISRMVAGRTREIGVRMALGANRTEIAALIFAGAGKLVLAGLAAGLLLALAGERFIRSMLFAVSPLDSATLTGTIAILAIVAALATLLPARKAASIDPVIAIRED
jgi:predicted lysophospholipase L1 biosynthesis ABC-type transport system permease subunit